MAFKTSDSKELVVVLYNDIIGSLKFKHEDELTYMFVFRNLPILQFESLIKEFHVAQYITSYNTPGK